MQNPALYAQSVCALAEQVAEDRNALLVVVVAGDGDVNNSAAMRVCKGVDPQALRTMGVLTKVRLLAPKIVTAVPHANTLPSRMQPVPVGQSGP